MDRPCRPHNRSTEGLRNRLMAQAHSENWKFRMHRPYQIKRNTCLIRRTRSGRQNYSIRPETAYLYNVHFIISHNMGLLPQPLEVPGEIVDKAIVVINQQKHSSRFMDAEGPEIIRIL